MADRTVVCKQCGETLKVSEYADTKSIVCRECGTAVTLPPPGPSKSRTMNFKAPEVPPLPVATPDQVAATLKGLRQVEDIEKDRARLPKMVWGWITFISLSLLLLGGIWACRETDIFDKVYLIGRWIVVLIVFLLLCADAFSDAYVTGFLCMFLLPYTVFYGLTSADYYPLRGAFAAILVMICAEVWLLPEDSLMTHANDIATVVIDFGQNNIRRAGEAPTF